MIFAVILLIIAGILLYYNTEESNRVEEENLETVMQLEEIIEEQQEETSNSEDENNDSIEKTTITINGNNYIGIIYIPILNNLALPVIENCTDANLKISVCKYAGSVYENNLVIAGHRYKSTFAKLSKLQNGNIAYFKDVNGNVYKYRFDTVENLTPTQVSEMQTGDWDMTLFTCTYNNANRLAYRFILD